MGSYNITDAVSGLPIRDGQKVKLLFLVPNFLDGFTDCTRSFTSIFRFYINATYDDYGKFTIYETNEVKQDMTNLFKKYLVPIEEGDNNYHDIPINIDNFDIDKIFEYMKEGRLMLRPSYTNNSDAKPISNLVVSYAAIDNGLFNDIRNNMSFTMYNSDISGYESKSYNDIFNTKVTNIHDFYRDFPDKNTFNLGFILMDNVKYLNKAVVDKMTSDMYDGSLLGVAYDDLKPFVDLFPRDFLICTDKDSDIFTFDSFTTKVDMDMVRNIEWNIFASYFTNCNYSFIPSRYSCDDGLEDIGTFQDTITAHTNKSIAEFRNND